MKILIICTGNTCRSPMAEGIVNDMIQKRGLEDVKVSSMGLGAYDGESPTANAIEAMKEIGIDISKKKSQRVMLQDLTEADLFYVMTQSHKNILADTLPEIEDQITVLDIPDPYGRDIGVYRDCRDAMIRFFEKEFAKIDGDIDDESAE